MKLLKIYYDLTHSNKRNLLSIDEQRHRMLLNMSFYFWTIASLPMPFILAHAFSFAAQLKLACLFGGLALFVYAIKAKGSHILAKNAIIFNCVLTISILEIAFGEHSRGTWLILSFTAMLFMLMYRLKFGFSAMLCCAFYVGLTVFHSKYPPLYAIEVNVYYDIYVGVLQLGFFMVLMKFHAENLGISIRHSLAKQKELQILNDDLTKSKTALEKLNLELHQFASCASHDMREPLRTISSFSTLVMKRLAATDKNQEMLEFVVDAAKRMTLLLDDLINYTRVTQIEVIESEWVNLNTVLSDVKRNLYLKITESQAEIFVSPQLPLIRASKSHMVILFQNLISNSIKYSDESRKPQIYINWVKKDEGLAMTFRDNGIGIEQQYLLDIFEPFRRLHSIGKYEGSGIGLATCRKIAETYGGKIVATSEYGHSTTILIDLSVELEVISNTLQVDNLIFSSPENQFTRQDIRTLPPQNL